MIRLRDFRPALFDVLHRHAFGGALAVLLIGIGIAAAVLAAALRENHLETRHAVTAVPDAERLDIFPAAQPASSTESATAVVSPASSLRVDDVAALRDIHGVALVAGSVCGLSAQNSLDEATPVRIYAVDAAYFAIHGWTVAGGFDSPDAAAADRGADAAPHRVVIGSALRDKLFADADPRGRSIRIGDTDYRVGGVVWASDGNAQLVDASASLFVPLADAQRLAGNGASFSSGMLKRISLRLDPHADAAALQGAIRQALRQRHALGPSQADDFQLRDFSTVASATAYPQASARRCARLALLALLFGAIALTRSMLLSVHDRATEIGLRIAVGAAPRAIQAQVLGETLLLAGLGALLGLLLGALAWALLTHAGYRSLQPSTTALALVAAVVLLLGTVAGIWPARRAARLDAAAALRYP